MPEQPDKKNSWKSLAGNLFGMEFDDPFDLDELDLDSVADVVDQVSAAEDHCEHDCSCDHDHDHEETEAAEALPRGTAQNPESPARTPSPEQVKMKEEKKPKRTRSSDRSSYEDEDLFGFGIMLTDLDSDLDSEEDDDAEDSDDSYEGEELSGESAILEVDSAPVATDEIEEIVAGNMEDEISLEDFDFDFDFEEEEDAQPEPVKKAAPAAEVRSSPAPRAEKPAAVSAAAAEPEAEATPRKKAGKSEEDDDFWSSLEEWDWNKENSGRSEKGKRGRRGSSRRSETPALIEEAAAELVAETAAEASEAEGAADEQEQTGGSRRRRPRRRRRGQGKEAVGADVTASEAEAIAEEIDPDLIDRLWSDEDEETVVTPAASTPVEPKRISREQHSRSRGRGRTDDAAKSSAEPRGNQGKSQPDSARKSVVKAVEETDDDASDTDHEDHKAKVVPTWTEAIGLIVRRRDTGGGERGRSRRDQGNRRQEGSRGEERGGQRRRPRPSSEH